MPKSILQDQRGQYQLVMLFAVLIVYLGLTVAWIAIANELITNYIAPTVSTLPYGGIGLILLYIAAYLFWFIIPLVLIAAALQGREVQG